MPVALRGSPPTLKDFGLNASTPLRETCYRFVFVGRMTRTRGIDTILRALPLLDADISIDVFGPLE